MINFNGELDVFKEPKIVTLKRGIMEFNPLKIIFESRKRSFMFNVFLRKGFIQGMRLVFIPFRLFGQ